MLRRLFTFLSAVSLALCIGTCVLWARSYWVEERVARRSFDPPGPHPHELDVPPRMTDVTGRVARGEVRVTVESRLWTNEVLTTRDERWGGGGAGARARRPAGGGIGTADGTWWDRRGFRGAWRGPRGPDPRRSAEYEVGCPLWVPAALSAAAPAGRVCRRARSRRPSSHRLCPACGYDLRATPGRCPECGLVPAAATAGAA